MRRIVGLVGGAMLAAGMALAQDPAVVDPAHVKVEFQSEQVRVLRIRLGPHEKLPFHGHPARVIVFLTDNHNRSRTADGKVQEMNARAGQVLWTEPLTLPHVVETGDRATETIEVELVGKPGAALPAPSPDPVKVDPKHCKVEFENDLVRVLRWTVPPHEKVPLHEHGPGVSVLLTDLWIKGVEVDGKPTESKATAGTVAWGAGHRHADENASDNPLEVIHVEMKRAASQ